MDDPRRLAETRTFRWSDGESTDGYEAVEIARSGLVWFRWSHVHGEGRVVESEQSLTTYLDVGPPRTCPKSVEEQLRAIALRWLDA